MSGPQLSGKPFDISKQEVWRAYQKVKANKGAPGVDDCSVEAFEKDLKNNLYKIWNRMSSGSYFPPPVRAVEMPKPSGGVRVLGVPTVADRVAQTVVAEKLEKRVEPIFHPDSYGYRPGRSALDAVGQCRRRCWNRAWVVDLDIARFFDEVDHQLLLKAVAGHAPEPWVLLYISRWLKAPIQHGDGTIAQRSRGTPQGSAVSPVLANLFLHYAFDMWMARRFPTVQFERYVDDVVVHCVTERQAREVREAVEGRLARVGLRMHPDKTRIVYCRTQKRRGDHPEVSFDFLGYTFRPRAARDGKGGIFTSFLPAISKSALKRLSARVRSWRLHLRTGSTLTGLARTINLIVRGWMQYYGRFYRTALYPLLKRINAYLVRWLRKKYKRLRTFKKAKAAWRRVTRQCPLLLSHWAWVQSFW